MLHAHIKQFPIYAIYTDFQETTDLETIKEQQVTTQATHNTPEFKYVPMMSRDHSPETSQIGLDSTTAGQNGPDE